LKVCIVSTGSINDCFPPKTGGIEVLEFDLIKQFSKKGIQVQLFASKSSIPNSIEIGSKIKSPRIHQFLAMLKCFAKRSKLNADIVHCHHPLTALPFLKKKPLVFTEHNWYNLPGMDFHRTIFTKIFDLAQKKVYKKADKIIALSSEMLEILTKKISKEKIVLIPNFVDSTLFKPLKKDFKKILFVGRLEKEKGIPLLFKALKGLKNYELLIIGDGSQKKQLQKMALNLRINARFLGQVPHDKLVKEFGTAGIFVLPSYFEVMPVVILEAMSSGCAIIASNAFGIKDQIDSQENGFIIEKGNSVQLKEKLELLLNDASLQKIFGAKARKKVLKKFDATIVSQQIIKLYEELINE
jgi:glycosyltransferase involved in cell wall biosynthesis